MHARIRPEPRGLPNLKQVARHMLARAREDTKAFEASAEHEHDIIARLDASERLLYINLTGERVYGSSRSAFVGKLVQELGLPRETTRRIREGLQRVFATGEAVEPRIELPVKGDTLHFKTIIAPDGREAGRPACVLLLARDVTERRRAEEALRQLEAEKKARGAAEEAVRRSLLLAEVTALLDSFRDPRAALPRLAELLVTRIADLCVIDVVDEGGSLTRAAVAHSLASKAPLARELMVRFPPRVHLGGLSPEVLASRTPRLFNAGTGDPLAAAAFNEEHLRILRALGPRSTVIIPLYSHGRATGTLGLAVTESDRQYTLDDMAFMVELGRQVAIAIESALLQRQAKEAQVAAERAARFAKRLLEATLAISEAATAPDIAVQALEQLGLALQATSAAIYTLSGDGRSLEPFEARGFGSTDLTALKLAPIPLDAPLPLAHAVARGELLQLPPAELAARFPAANGEPREKETIVCAPLRVEAQIIGGVSLSFKGERALDADDRAFIETVARVGAHALERTRLYHGLASTEHKLASIVRTAPLAIMVFDFDGTVRSWNPAAEAIFGWSSEEACGRFMPAVPDERRAEFLGHLDALTKGEVIAGREMLRRRKDGELFPVVVWWSKLNNPDGSSQCMAIAKDITALWLGDRKGELHAAHAGPEAPPKGARARE